MTLPFIPTYPLPFSAFSEPWEANFYRLHHQPPLLAASNWVSSSGGTSRQRGWEEREVRHFFPDPSLLFGRG